jgi:hypothetical protein
VVSQTYASVELLLLSASSVIEPESKAGSKATGPRLRSKESGSDASFLIAISISNVSVVVSVGVRWWWKVMVVEGDGGGR